MKKIIFLCSLLMSTMAFADDGSSGDDGTGYVIGVDGGVAHIHYAPDTYSSYLTPYTGGATSINHDEAMAYDVYFGYRLYRELGWELGYMKFHNATFNYNGAPTSLTAKRYDYDFLIRGDFPIMSSLGLFVKAGVAQVHSRFEAQSGDTSNITALTPAYGMGVSYHITGNTDLNTQWLHINKVKPNARTGGISAPDVPVTNYFSVGFGYRF